jgi:hyperosmotically inducible protein
VLSRLLAFVVLVVLVGGGLYYWKLGGGGLPAPEDFGEIGQHLRDTAVTAAVKGAMGLNRQLQPYGIGVETEDRVVVLRGKLPREELKQLAEAVAAAVPEVRQVVNHLRVTPDAVAAAPNTDRSLGESFDDEALEVQVRLAFSLHRDLKGTAVQVEAYRRAVTLGGEVSRTSQRRLASRIARDTPGVASVTDKIRVAGVAEEDAAGAVERVLAANANLAPYGISAHEEAGRLVLEGRVRTGAESDLAEVLAGSAVELPIENRLEIRP